MSQLDLFAARPRPQPPTWGPFLPRAWQAAALPIALQHIADGGRSVISAIMGSGKSVLIAEICKRTRGRIVVTVPTVALVEQLSATISRRCGAVSVGCYYTHASDTDCRITVVCLPSLTRYVEATAHLPPPLWIADEAHRTEAEQCVAVYDSLAPHAALGVTATPFRADESERLSLWDSLAYEYTAADALRDGVVVPFRVQLWDGEGTSDLDAVCLRLIRKHAQGPGLVNARNIEDAEAHAEWLTARGVSAVAVHSAIDRDEIAARLERLRVGELACVVHVSMLQEGVDLPWLRWLCMRRPVRSRVRFVQEVGRVLRAHEGKTRAELLDPHDLFDSFGLTYQAILAGDTKPAKANADPLADEIAACLGIDPDVPEYPWAPLEQAKARARRLKPVRRYVRRLYLALLAEGVIEERISSTHWRGKPPSEKQLGAVGWMCGGMARDTAIPLPHRKALAVVRENAADLKRGDVSDLLSIGAAMKARKRRGDPWPLGGE